jgi:hypothetical protein
MNMPGFVAEWSLGPARGLYRGKALAGGSGAAEGGAGFPSWGTLQPALGHGRGGPAPPSVRPTSTIQPMLKKAEHCTTVWSGFVTYPMRVCQPPFLPPGSGTGSVVTVDDNGTPGVGSPPTLFSTDARTAPVPVGPRFGFCRTVYGPWLASVAQEEACDTRLPDTFTLTITGAPQPVQLFWLGDLKNAPPEVGSIGNLSPTKPSCDCCPGFKECLKSCIPISSTCENSIPA